MQPLTARYVQRWLLELMALDETLGSTLRLKATHKNGRSDVEFFGVTDDGLVLDRWVPFQDLWSIEAWMLGMRVFSL